MSEPRIVTKSVTKSKEHKGWKVYIDGSKWPKKPVDYYAGMTEEQAVKKAVEEYRVYYKSPLFSGLCNGLEDKSCQKQQ